ncbi:MAG: MFS transporter [Gammaproteobacteria bacterium]|nr:MFS transporter [Gammaproteobacteria bacterium]
MFAHYLNNRRIVAVLIMGFSSGLPLALTGATLQAWYTKAGVNILNIGVLTLIGIPYTFKFLWAPLLDRFVPPFLGRRRGWLLITQMALCLLLLVLTFFNPLTQSKIMGVIALIIAFLSASQDIAYDAYRTDILLPTERGLGAAALAFGYRMAMIVSGGLALVLADHVGWKLTYQFMAAVMFFLGMITLFIPEVKNGINAPSSFIAAIIEPFKNAWKKDRIILILLFVVLYKIGDALALSLMSSFLLRELAFSLTQIGLIFKTVGLLATLIGAFLGGFILLRISLFQALLWFGLLQAFSNLMFMLLAYVGKNELLMVSSIFIEQCCSGMSTTAFVAFLMSLCDSRYTATQYAIFSALAAVGRVFLGPIAAIMIERVGWAHFFGWTTIACFPGLILLLLLRSRVKENVEVLA